MAREALRYAVETVHADHARVMLADGPGLRMARRAGADIGDESIDRLPPLWSRVPRDTRLPSVEVVNTGRSLRLGRADVGEIHGIAGGTVGSQAAALRRGGSLSTGQVAGAFSLGWERERTLGEGERAALLTVGNLIGSALTRARRFDEQRGHAETLQRNNLPAELPHIPGREHRRALHPQRPRHERGR